MDFGSAWSCELEGCPNEADGGYDEDDDAFPPMPPDGWVTVAVRRADAESLLLAFCSEAHLAQRMQAPLPAPVPTEEPTDSWVDNLIGAVLGTVLVSAFCLGLGVLGILAWEAGAFVLDRL